MNEMNNETDELKSAELNYKEKYDSIHKRREAIHVKVTKLMILCFLFEFTNRWVVQAMDSRLASYMNWKFDFSAVQYSILSCATGVVSCLEQALLYNYLVQKCNVPIVHLALVGVVLETIGYWIMAAASTVSFTIVGGLLLVIGYCFASPASMSVISTTNPAEVQGKVLSWNNLWQQISCVVSPLVLSAVYTANPNATYYSCMIVSGVCIIALCFIISMPNSKLFGKVNVFEAKEKGELPTKKDIEMTTNEGGEVGESKLDVVTIPNSETSTVEVASELAPVPTTSVVPPVQAAEISVPVPAENGVASAEINPAPANSTPSAL